jgi:uncharacterized protein
MRSAFLLLLAMTLTLFSSAGWALGERADKNKLPVEDIVIETAAGAHHTIHAEIALTGPELVQGLMFRTEMAEDAGMLFVFGEEAQRRFWMKNTFIPLDILFITGDGVIRHIHPDAVPHDLTGIPSMGAVSRVLELNGGTAERLGIRPGDRVRHKEYFSDKPSD